MTNYFNSIGTKPIIESDKPFARVDAQLDLLLDFFHQQPPPNKSQLNEFEKMYREWCEKIFSGFNIVMTGHPSKFRLIETFRKTYLDSKKLDGRNITTVRLHGFTPITVENFSHAVFGKTEGKSASNDDIIKFLAETKDSKTHYIFLLHSFEDFYKECKHVCDIIFQLYTECPEFCHIILSSDHINGCKIINKLKLPLRFVSYYEPYGESFFYERTHASLVEGVGQAAITDQNFNLESLKDVHQAMQKSCQQVMVYVLKYHVEQNHKEIPLDFDVLFNHCESKFWLRRANMLRAHLGELADHSIVRQEGNTIYCPIELETCYKFLQSIGEEVTMGINLPLGPVKRKRK